MWESIGFIIAYVCSGILCTTSKVYIMISFLCIGMIGYTIIEVLEKWQKLPRDSNGEPLTIIKLILTFKETKM